MEDYGVELILDLHECNPETFTRQSITRYFNQLCELIEMQVEDCHFWTSDEPPNSKADPKTYGNSAVQFILTSSIVVHCLPLLRKAYINIFSCKDFDTDVAIVFTREWFTVGSYYKTVVRRR